MTTGNETSASLRRDRVENELGGSVKPELGLLSSSFLGLLLTQLLTAINDNAFRWLVIGIGKMSLEETGKQENVSLILAAGTACFVLPYLLFAAPAGYLADRFSKRTVIVLCKVGEIAIMALGIAAMVTGNLWFLFVVVALMGLQSALFSPAKLGSIPEMLRAECISAANAMIGLTTVIATVVGMALGNILSDLIRDNFRTGVAYSSAVLIGVAVAGWLISLAIARLKAADPQRNFPWDALPQTVRDIRTLASSTPLLRVALGIMFFWSVGALAQLNVDQFAFEGGAEKQTDIVPLLLTLVAGVGLGSVLAGIWSGGRVELGILPLGAGGLAISSMLLFTVQGPLIGADSAWTVNYVLAASLLFLIGCSAGLFDVPLAAYMQHHSPPQSRGSILAASNFLTFFGILLTAVLYYVLRAPLREDNLPLFSSRQIFLLSGLGTIPVFIYIVWLIPQASIRFLVWLASHTVYRIRVFGRENLPERGPALIVVNHVSWLDGGLMYLTSSRPIRIVAYAGNFETAWMKRLARLFGVILIRSGPKSIRNALETANHALKNGELVCIFPEGAITRTGQLQEFKPGLLKILEGADAPVIPCYLDELWGSIFSFEGGRFFWKWPRKWPYPISIHFGKPVANAQDVHELRQAVQELGTIAVQQRTQRMMQLAKSFVRTCKKRKRGSKIADSSGNELTGGGLLTRSLILRRLLRRHVLSDDEQFVGLLLPPSVGGFVANMALALDRRVPVNLNYTVKSDVINQCMRQAGIKHVLTSRKFMEKMKFELEAEVVYLEDFRSKPTLGDKLRCALAAHVLPAAVVERSLKLGDVKADDLATVIFTSGSTGEPKGVMLTQANIASNVAAIEQAVHLDSNDVLIGILPFFHSFGFTVTMWATATIDVKCVYHFNPLDGKQVGKLCKAHGVTVLLATPTFLRTYLRRCDKEELVALEVVVAGAEKLPKDLCDAFEEKFGIRPYEGYGTTELSPLVSVNVPPNRSLGDSASECKEGSVGRPVAGVSAKITDLETGETLSAGKSGMLWIKGPNVMKGYLGREDLTADVIRDGWYKTGDVAFLDEQGFIHITGRESRFSKIGGEMVPHLKIEETLSKLIGVAEEEGLQAAVTAVPHEKKGERLIVVHKPLAKPIDELRKGLSAAGLPNIFIPSEDSFLEVAELPMLGTGKLDLKGIRQIAQEHFHADNE